MHAVFYKLYGQIRIKAHTIHVVFVMILSIFFKIFQFTFSSLYRVTYIMHVTG